MSWLRRKRADESTADPGVQAAPATPEDAGPDEDDAAERARLVRASELEKLQESRRRTGPFDESEVDDDVTRVDLGALRVPPRQGMELRLEIEEKTQRVVAATVTLGASSVQLQAFAAPRRDGVWDDIRGELAAQVTRQGGTADEITGTFGREILARIPARTADGRTGHQVARFTGVDGPRWFLRAVFNGKAAVDEDEAKALEEVVRGIVVVRGSDARPPRDLLSLKLPARPDQPAAENADAAAAPAPSLDPLRRGPEITEIH